MGELNQTTCESVLPITSRFTSMAGMGLGRSGMCYTSELAMQWCANHAAYLLCGEFIFGEEVAKLHQHPLPKKKGQINNKAHS
jgi:hypothetical protein